MKTLFRKIYYKSYPYNSLKPFDLRLGYIFHTEKIYDTSLFEQLIHFCEAYTNATGATAICTIIPPTNLLLKKQLQDANTDVNQFIERLRRLETVATLGYHGHFYQGNEPFNYNAIHCNSFSSSDLKEQFEKDINWFMVNNINHNGIYAGGWWFMNEILASLLIENGFNYDYSFSQAPYFYNMFSSEMMYSNRIPAGTPFFIKHLKSEGKLLCIQNFIGAHRTPFVQDFDRNMKKILSDQKKGFHLGVINSHDYDLSLYYTLSCISHLMKNSNAKFHSHEQLILLAKSLPLKTLDFNI